MAHACYATWVVTSATTHDILGVFTHKRALRDWAENFIQLTSYGEIPDTIACRQLTPNPKSIANTVVVKHVDLNALVKDSSGSSD